MKRIVACLVLIICCSSILMAGAASSPVVLESRTLRVTVDPAFPRLIRYEVKAGGSAIEGQAAPVSTVEINGQIEPCRISFKKRTAASAEYRLVFPGMDVEVILLVAVGEEAVDLRVTAIKERGAVKLKTLFFPGNSLLTVRSTQPDAEIAAMLGTCMNDHYQGTFREKIAPLASLAPMADTGNYFFISAGRVAAGIADNNVVDIQRTAWNVDLKDGIKTCAAWCPAWIYREIDSEITELPWTRIFITGDRNGDGKADWQDAALVYRAVMPKPFGHEYVRTTVGENIAMNFASGAQQPFLKILDEIKKCNLATDGIGQQVVIKGFSSEGHDSANTDYCGHYNDRAGGLKDFTVLLNHAHEYNARVGIHINASEVYPEAHRYKPEILQRDGNGNPKGGWAWLDHAQMIDKKKDTVSGNLYAALEQMRRDLPGLDCVYVDTYWEHGWPAWKIVTKLNSLGLPMYTEGDLPLDPWTTWAHWRGGGSKIMRFIWYSDRDIFSNDALLRGGRGDGDGFMGWQNQHNFNSFLRGTFAGHLPGKFLQHFDLLRWEPGREADFSGGVKVRADGDQVTVTQNGRVVMTWKGGGSQQRLFVPWEPQAAPKIYVWDEIGDEHAWDLPPSWQGRREVYLYRLTDMGRTEEVCLPVTSGRVTLKVQKAVPYVIYPKQAPAQKPLMWGEGSVVKDPGFDSHGFASWIPLNPGVSPRVEEDGRGNPRLVISGGDSAVGGVSQVVSGLEGGKTYAASAWVQVTGKRLASVIVQPLAEGAMPCSNYVFRTDVRHSAPNDPRTGSNYQRVRVLVPMPKGCSQARITLKAEKGTAGTVVEFDDVRVVETHVSPAAAKHWFWEDFENIETGGYGPFTCCPGERTHLSEANPPYTRDTINGRFSLKSRDGGRVVRSLPCTIRFKPNTRYRVTCETMGIGHLAAESKGKTLLQLEFPGTRGQVSGEFATGNDTESYLSLYRDGGDSIVIDDLAIDELGPAPVIPEGAKEDDILSGRRLLLEERFGKPLSPDWTVITSKHPGTAVTTGAEGLVIKAAANVSALAERNLPAGTTAVDCRLIVDGDEGQTWGPGLCLLWPNGAQLRVNLRSPDGCFGVDSTASAQKKVGTLGGDGAVTLRIRLDSDKIIVEAKNEGVAWQELATFPGAKFGGAPSKVRIGKTHGVEGTDDHGDPGPEGTTTIQAIRIYGK